MPKIIENLEHLLIEEAKKQIEDNGYATMTIRSVAKACGVGVGTVYNYFPSKEALVATHLLKDWNQCVVAVNVVSEGADAPKQVAQCIYDQLKAFSGRHMAVFGDKAAVSGFSGSASQYHSLLRDQLAQPLRRFCDSDFAAQFIAEGLLTWTMANKSFEEIYDVIEKLF